MHNPNYKGKNYDPNFQAKHAEAAHPSGKQQQNSFAAPNQYKQAYNKPTSTYGSNNNTPLSSSSDIIWRGDPQDFGRWVSAPEGQRDDKECCCLEGENAKS